MNKNTLIIIIVTIGIILAVFAGVFILTAKKASPEPTPEPSIAPQSITSFDECASAGYPVLESYPRQCKTSDGQSFTEDIGNELEKIDLIRVSNPRPNQVVQSPILIEGEARGNWFFEASFPVLLLDEQGNTLATATSQAEGEWMTEDFVPFTASLSFQPPSAKKGTLVLKKDNPSDLPEFDDELRIPVVFDTSETLTVKVFFGNSKLDPELSCNKAFPVERIIEKKSSVARAALEELLKGPTAEEKVQGYGTTINPGVTINKLIIEDGVLEVDFDESLEFQVGGSCRVSAIRAEITQTLMQFPTVDEVIISINGRTEDILQP